MSNDRGLISNGLIASYEISPDDAKLAAPQYMNIIKDEMNHALRFIF